MRTLILLVILLLPRTASALITIVTGPVQANISTGVNVDIASTAFTTANSLIVFVQFTHNTASVTSVTYDPGGGNQTALTQIGTLFATGLGNHKIDSYYLSSIPTTASKVVRAVMSATMAGVDGGTSEITVFELAGGDPAGLLDAHNSNTGTTGQTLSVNLTTVAASAGVFAVGNTNGGGDPIVGAGYTVIPMITTGYWVDGQYNLNVGAPGAKTVSMTSISSGGWGIKAVSLKPLVSAPATVAPRRRISN